MTKRSAVELLERLKQSLPDSPPESPASIAPPLTVQTAPLARPHAPKLSVSLYPKDLDRLDEIKAFMQQQGFRNLSDSEALRLACRAVPITDQFIALYRDMQMEDGRRKR